MALKFYTKISGINNLSDARYCAGMGVDILGFNLEKDNANYIDALKYTAITEWLSGVTYCAEFENSTTDQILMALKQYPKVSYVQISDIQLVSSLTRLEPEIIVKLPISVLAGSHDGLRKILESTHYQVKYYLIEDDLNILDDDLLDRAIELSNQYPILLGFGLNQHNIHSVMEKSKLKGIALRGGNEIKPGYKDFDDLADILDAIEIDDTL